MQLISNPRKVAGATCGMSMNTKQLAWRIRRNAIDMVHHAHASHIGGVLSVADIVAVLYGKIAKVDPQNPHWSDRDRIVMSKGHNGVAIYAILAEIGFFPVEQLGTYGEDGGIFSCHVSHKNVPGVELSTGSLGHGVCVACGMALNAKLRKKDYRTFAIVGDGECNEGSVWEAAMLASQQKLSNFTVIVDCNGMQAMGECADVINMEPMSDKWKSFGWHVAEVNGHDHDALLHAFEEDSSGKPKVILARTIKGKGVSFMENQNLWHYRDPQGDAYEQAVAELEANKV